MLFRIFASLAALAGPALAAPAVPIAERAASLPSDAPYTQSSATYEAAITCPNGIKNQAGGIVFLIHGTGSRGNESWANGPYNIFLSKRGYDICWVDLPSRSLADAQLSAEYVAYGISYLAAKSSTKKVNLVGHSQGAGLNPQWALTFWPSKRALVSNYIALAPDYHGTIEGSLLCTATAAVGCQPSIFQQSVPARYLTAQNSNKDSNSGAQALVPTISLFTRTDDVVEPETVNAIATSNLPGSTVLAMQDLQVCGPTHLADHFSMIVDPAAFGLAAATLQYGAANALAHFNKAYCTYFVDDVLANFTNVPPLVRSIFADVLAIGTYPRVSSEPLLQPYVCQRGYASGADCQANSGFANNYVR